jgi:hypothetical protein
MGNRVCQILLIPALKPCACNTCDKDGNPKLDRREPPPSLISQKPAFESTTAIEARDQITRLPWEFPAPGYYPWDEMGPRSSEPQVIEVHTGPDTEQEETG